MVAASLRLVPPRWLAAPALRIRRVDLGDQVLPDGTCDNPLPSEPRAVDNEPFPIGPRHGARQAVEYWYEGKGGYYWDPTWVRLRVDVIAGQPATPLSRLAYTADLASGIGVARELPVSGINADLAIHVIRYPEGEWLCLGGRGWISRQGIGQVQATISDTGGITAAVSMARLVDPAPN